MNRSLKKCARCLNDVRAVPIRRMDLSAGTAWMSVCVLTKKKGVMPERKKHDISSCCRQPLSSRVWCCHNVKALSWTLSRETAEWFAHRFDEDGTVYEAKIDKKHICALFTGRNESEVIVDPKQLKDIIIAPEMEQEPTMTM